jgi:hypothetical protein
VCAVLALELSKGTSEDLDDYACQHSHRVDWPYLFDKVSAEPMAAAGPTLITYVLHGMEEHMDLLFGLVSTCFRSYATPSKAWESWVLLADNPAICMRVRRAAMDPPFEVDRQQSVCVSYLLRNVST